MAGPSPTTKLLLPALLLLGLLAPAPSAADAGVTTLYRRTRAWSDYAEPLAVLRVARPPTALLWLDDAPARLLAVGDAAGHVHLLTLGGRPALPPYDTGAASPVTALAAFRVSRNTSVLLSGHGSGEVCLHALLLPRPWLAATDDELDAGSDGAGALPALSLDLLHTVAAEALLCGTPAAGSCSGGDPGSLAGTCAAAPAAGCAAITALHAVARGSPAAATILAADAAGRLAVLKHGGPTGLGVRVVRRSALEQPPTAVRLSPTVAAVVGSSGVASQRLTSPAAVPQQQEQQRGNRAPAFQACAGLNGSTIVAAAFHARSTTRAYALTSSGRLLALAVGGERGMQPGCTVRSWVAAPPSLLAAAAAAAADQRQQQGQQQGQQEQQEQQAWTLVTQPGYVLTLAADSLSVFNVSVGPRTPPRLLLQQPLGSLREQFGLAAAPAAASCSAAKSSRVWGKAAPAAAPAATDAATAAGACAVPLLAVGRQGRHVALALNATVLAVYAVSLPHRAPPAPYSGAMGWMKLLQPFCMVGIAVVVLYRARERRRGGGADFGLADMGGLSADPRLREFERLLQSSGPSGGARRPLAGWGGGSGGGDSSGSDADDSSMLGRPAAPLGRGLGGGGGGSQPRSGGSGLFGRRGKEASGGGGGDAAALGGRELAARSRRAAALAADDDRDIAALRAELAGARVAGGGGGGSGDEAMGGAFGSELDAPPGPPVSDEVSSLRQRFGAARIS